MIDLHLHLDGSLSKDDITYLAKKQNKTIDFNNLSVTMDCRDLNQYLKCFDTPLSLLQDGDSVAYAFKSLCNRLKTDRYIYAEIRFAPQLHTLKGMTQQEVVLCAIEGMKESNFFSNLILCCMRGNNNEEANFETVETGKKYLNKGVCALDLAGAEGIYKTREFKNIFTLVNKYNIPFTLHAGEADDFYSIDTAIEFGAKRIGHGINAINSLKTMEKLRDSKIPLELCPTSNLQTKAISCLDNYPIKKFMDFGIIVTVNSDNMTVSNTNVCNEFNLLKNNNLIEEKDIPTLIKNSIYSAFLSEEEKEMLLKKALHPGGTLCEF